MALGQGISATIKHFAGNESEIERTTISSNIDERALREIYLRPFEAAVTAKGTPASHSAMRVSIAPRAEWPGCEIAPLAGSITVVACLATSCSNAAISVS